MKSEINEEDSFEEKNDFEEENRKAYHEEMLKQAKIFRKMWRKKRKQCYEQGVKGESGKMNENRTFPPKNHGSCRNRLTKNAKMEVFKHSISSVEEVRKLRRMLLPLQHELRG